MRQKPKAKKAKSKKKSKAAAEYYDVSDPFIDDSELAIDERTYFAQTKQKGFYVSSGEVALVRDKCVYFLCIRTAIDAYTKRSPKKPKSRKKVGPALSLNLPTASTSALKPASAASKKAKSVSAAGASKSAPASKAKAPAAKALGTKDSPIPLEDEDEDNKADVFGFAKKVSASAKGKGKEKAEMDEGGEEAVIAAMKGKWKERVSVNGANGSVNGDQEGDEGEIDGDDEVGKKRKRAVNGGGDGTKKRKTVDIASFHPDLQAGIEKMKQAIAAGAFPSIFLFRP